MSGLRMRSLLVSCATTALDAGLFALCTLVLDGPALLVARWGSGAVGAVANFVLNRRWAFRARGTRVAPQMGRYAVTSVTAVSLATMAWWGLRLATGLDPRLLHLISLASVWMTFTFPVMRAWVFRPGERVAI